MGEHTTLSDKSVSNLNRLLLLANKAIRCIGSTHPDMSAYITGIDDGLQDETFVKMLDKLENTPDWHTRHG